MDDWWVTLLREQQRNGFPDLDGAHGTIVLPLSDRLISRIVEQRMPASLPVRGFQLRAHAGNRITVSVRLAKAAFLPPIQVTLAIDRQPALPASPALGLVMESQAMAGLGAMALRFVDILPAGVRLEEGRLTIDLRTLLERRNAADVLTYLTELKVTTEAGRVVVHARGGIPPASKASM